MRNTLYILFLLLVIPQIIFAQCKFGVSVVMQKESDCQSNGVIKASLTGDLQDLDLDDALFSLVAVSGGHDKAFSKNNGLIIQVAPGTYIVRAQVYCKKTKTREIVESTIIVMKGTYPGFEHEKIKVQSANIVKSQKCQPTGEVPIEIYGGRFPYTITIVSADSANLINKTYTQSSPGVISIKDLPAGNYTFSILDACLYKAPDLVCVVGEVIPIITQSTTKTFSCKNTGTITFNISDVEFPCTIKMLTPRVEEYILANSGLYTISGLEEGNYSFQILNNCFKILKDFSLIQIETTIVKLRATVSHAINCGAKGSANILVKGGSPGYELSSSPIIPSLPSIQANEGNISLPNLSPGSYSIYVEDDCGDKDTVNFEIKAGKLKVETTVRKTLNCKETGRITVDLEGAPAYTVTLISTGNPDIVKTNITGNFIFDSIPGGEYLVAIEDGCPTFDTIKLQVDTLFVTDIINPLEDFFYRPFIQPYNCFDLIIKKEMATLDKDILYYWADSSKYFFEIRYSKNETGVWSAWEPAIFGKDTIFNTIDEYCTLRANDSLYVAEIRIENTDETVCGMQPDTIRFYEIVAVSDYKIKGCDGIDVLFWQNTDFKGVICYPYNWTLVNSNNIILARGTKNDPSQEIITDLPHGEYTVNFEDACGEKWQTKIKSDWKETLTYKLGKEEYVSCRNYNIGFQFKGQCSNSYNFTLRSIASNDTLVNINSTNSNEKLNDLKYDTVYELTLTRYDTVIVDTFSFSLPINPYPYLITSQVSYCLPDTARGCIVLQRASNEKFEDGTLIEFIDGPFSPYSDSVVIQGTTLGKYYPFSADSSMQVLLDLPAGIYRFKISDSCNRVENLVINYAPSTIKDFGFDTINGCKGLQLIPKGQIYLGTTPVNTYYHIIETPQGVAPITDVVSPGGYFTLQESGYYKMRATVERAQSSTCSFDTISVFYNKITLGLNTEASRSYICAEGEEGLIKLKAKGGVGEYRYELFKVGEVAMVESNYTGEFNRGKLGENYIVYIVDTACDVSFPQEVTMLDLAKEQLIDGTEKLCLLDTIKLNCISLGDGSTYNWTGPNFTSAERSTFIDSAKVENSGEYILTITPYGCNKSISQSLNVEVISPDPPIVNPVVFCQFQTSSQLVINSPIDYISKWFNTDTISINAPTPSTNIPDTLHYLVMYVHEYMMCQSAKTPVEVIISPLPISEVEAYAPDICPGIFPTIFIPKTEIDYTYRVYNGNNMLLSEKVYSTDTLVLTGTERIYNNTRYYVEVANEHNCASLDKAPFDINIVDYLEISPDKIPDYTRNRYYSFFLQTNANPPYVFRTSDILPATLQLSAVGEIYGTPPRNGFIDKGIFTVEVEDIDGCIKDKIYELESELFVPQIITPNGDGFNDHFMPGHRLIIFDRLGIKVFDGDDGWDGSYKGKPAPPDTYFYVIFYKDDNQKELRKEGYVTILKR